MLQPDCSQGRQGKLAQPGAVVALQCVQLLAVRVDGVPQVRQPQVDGPLRGVRHREGAFHCAALRVAAHDDVLHL